MFEKNFRSLTTLQRLVYEDLCSGETVAKSAERLGKSRAAIASARAIAKAKMGLTSITEYERSIMDRLASGERLVDIARASGTPYLVRRAVYLARCKLRAAEP